MSAAARRTLAPLAVVTAAAFAFALLLVLVRLQWAPLESADHGAAARLNSLVAGHAAVVSIVKAVTWLGSGGVLWALTGMAVVVLAIRRRWWLAIYLLVTGAGELALDPVLKALVGRLRPVVAHPIAYGRGDSFPSGHALGSIVCYGALFLVFLPATRGMWRWVFTAVIVTLIAAIGISRLLLGVHYLSDVLGAWALGITWLGVTAFAFELSRQATGAPVADPVTAGLEPEARTDLQPAEPETTMEHDRARSYGRIAAGVVVSWVLIVGALTGIGKLIMITRNANGNLLGDHAIPHWFAAHRTPALNHWSLIGSNLGATQDILIVGVVSCVVFLAVTRRWRPVVFLAVVMFGELAAFLTVAAVVKRPRPDVPNLDSKLAHVGIPVRPHGRDHVPLRRHRHLGHRSRPRLVALPVPDPRDRHAGHDRRRPHVPGRASPHRHPRQPAVRRALADRHHDAHQAERECARPRGPHASGSAPPEGRRP